MGTKIEKFIEAMTPIFGEPYKDASGGVVEVLAKHLGQFDENVLLATTDYFATTRAYKTWPMPAEIIAACKIQERARQPVTPRPVKLDLWAWDRLKAADAMILCDLGVQAAEGGWLDELWHFCRCKARVPDEHEVDHICVEAERNMRKREATVDKIGNHKLWRNTKQALGLRQSLANLADCMQRNSRMRREMVLAWAGRRAA